MCKHDRQKYAGVGVCVVPNLMGSDYNCSPWGITVSKTRVQSKELIAKTTQQMQGLAGLCTSVPQEIQKAI